MSRFFGLALAGALVLGMANESDAQFGLSIGNPYSGTGINIGVPGAYGYGYSGYAPGAYGYSGYAPGVYGYNSGYGYSGYAPGSFSYSSGYGGYATPYVGGYGYGGYRAYRPIYGGYGRGYGGYGGYGRGYGGFRRGWR